MSETQHEVLKNAIDLVLEHKSDLDKELYEGIHFRVLGMKKGNDIRENLKKWFVLALGPGWRAGPAPSLDKRRRALQAFDPWYESAKNHILAECSGQQALDKLYESLDQIYTIGPKTAAVLLRDWIYYFDIWPRLKNSLYLPIDRHVRNIIVKKLKAGSEEEVPAVGEDYSTERNQAFQKELNEVHVPRVEFDYFWTIGSRFCSYCLCPVCWINPICKEHEYLFPIT